MAKRDLMLRTKTGSVHGNLIVHVCALLGNVLASCIWNEESVVGMG